MGLQPVYNDDTSGNDATSLQYSCGSFAIDSGASHRAGNCLTLPWIQFNSDGSYSWGSDQGTFDVQGDQVYFSGSLGGWGTGAINDDGQLVFQFVKGGLTYRVVYYPRPT